MARVDEFADRLLAWFDCHGRHDLPWQQQRSAYRVWLSEIMLQQTQVATVIPYFQRLVAAFPDVHTLAAAPLDEVLHLWSGLGYYARGRNLHRCAQIISSQYGGEFPRSVEGLSALPGIGESTAGAICAQAFNLPTPILDGNVKRVLTRYHAVSGVPDQGPVKKALWELARQHTPTTRVADYTQAIMDLGATLCTRRAPSCADCPLGDDCLAHQQGIEGQFPERKRKKALPVRQTRMLLIRAPDGAVMLEQRPAEGLWGGLWSLPEISLDQDIEQACEKLTGRAPLSVSDRPGFRHTFSHYHLDISPAELHIDPPRPAVMERDRQVWYKPGVMRLGLAAPVAKLLAANRKNEE